MTGAPEPEPPVGDSAASPERPARVVVVGAGAAGVAAALAARAAGAQVTVVSAAPGATALAAGAWDVAGDPKAVAGDRLDGRPSVREAAVRLAALRPGHPLARLGLGAAIEAHAAVLPTLGLYPAIDWDAPLAVVATDIGAVRSTATAQTSVLRLDALPADARVAVVELSGYRELDPVHVAQSLTDWAQSASAGMSFVPVEVDFLTRRTDALLSPHEIARTIETAEGTTRLGVALAESRQRMPFAAALLPGVLGVRGASGIASRLRELAGVPVGEMLAGPGTPQGLRLLAALDDALAPVERVTARVVGVDVERRRATAVRLDDGRTLAVDAVVLATGRFIGGGVAKAGRLRETVVDLPLFVDGAMCAPADTPFGTDPTSLFDEDVFGRHSALRIGVGWGDRLRPIAGDGALAAANLFAAGDLLEGHDPVADVSGFGVAVTTGFLAGRWAADVLR